MRDKPTPELMADLTHSLLRRFELLNIPKEDVTILEPQPLDGNTKWGLAGEAMQDGKLIRRAVRQSWA